MSATITVRATTTYKYIKFFNSFFELTDMEIRVLAKLYDLRETVNLCSATNKRRVAEALKIKDFNTLNNYVRILKQKKAIYKTKDGYEITDLLRPKKTLVRIEITTPENAPAS
jgi:hypothetical protein